MSLLSKLFRRQVTPEDQPPVSAPSQTAIATLPAEIEIQIGSGGIKIVDLLRWPSQEDCWNLEQSSEPVILVVSFENDEETEIPVYVRLCVELGGTSLRVRGNTGRDSTGLDVSLIYDRGDGYGNEYGDPDLPRLLLYKE